MVRLYYRQFPCLLLDNSFCAVAFVIVAKCFVIVTNILSGAGDVIFSQYVGLKISAPLFENTIV